MDRQKIIETLNRAYFSDRPDELEVLEALPPIFAGAKTFLDAGASLGQFVRLAAEHLRGAEIVAIEADPVRFAELEQNCATWAARTGNRIRAIHGALTDRSGPVRFQVTNSMVSGGLFRHELDHLRPEVQAEVRWEETEVRGYTLDELYPTEGPDFVKMDIEGAEGAALAGATRVLARGRTDWLIELHHFLDPSGRSPLQEVPPLMQNAGYRALDLCGRSLFLRRPWRTAPAIAWRNALAPWRRLPGQVWRKLKGK